MPWNKREITCGLAGFSEHFYQLVEVITKHACLSTPGLSET